ncbi:MAG: hypothetical protein RL398_284 [Planctomycetota bacterium]|jgi:N-glycosylase/DNA lyase
MPTTAVTLSPPRPFDLRLCLFGHGWVALAPHDWDEERHTFTTALAHGDGAIDVEVGETAGGDVEVRLGSRRKLSTGAAEAIAGQVAHMLRLDDDLTAFHALCRKDQGLRWAARRGAGRMLRSASAFEDLLKLLFTTNTTWSGTVAMTDKLVAACGVPAPSGRRAFPTPQTCPREVEFWRDRVKVGYRAEAAVRLVEAFADGTLDDATFLGAGSAEQLWQRVTSLRGFGPYAAGQAMRLFGHYEALALDSWCRARFAELDGTKKPPSDRQIAARYEGFAPFQGLAMWLDLTAEWHSEKAISRR